MKINNDFADKLCKAEIIKNALIVGQTSRLIVRLDDHYTLPEDVLNRDIQVRVTNGTYFVKYIPVGNNSSTPDLPFLIGNDLVGFTFKVKNSRHFRSLANVFPEVAWMLRNSNYDDDLFYAAKLHPGMIFYFSINWGKYVRSLTEQMDRDGIDPKVFKPLVTYRTAEKNWNYIMDAKSFAPDRRKYAKEIAEAKRIAAECED